MGIKTSKIGARYFDLKEYPQHLQDKYHGCGYCWLKIVNGELRDWGYADDDIAYTDEDDGVDEDLWVELCEMRHPDMIAGMASCWQLVILD